MKRSLAVLGLFIGCTNAAAPLPDAGHADAGAPDSGAPDAGPIDKAAGCVDTFGDVLTNAFGRVDGTIVAVVPPKHGCPTSNDDHVVLEVAMNGSVYRMVLNVISAYGPDYRVRFAKVAAALPAPAWSEGWHPGLLFDYATDLGLDDAAAEWTPLEMDPLVEAVTAELDVGAKISVYAVSSGGAKADSAHKVHRDGNHHDGAIVLDPLGDPRFLVFHFANQEW